MNNDLKEILWIIKSCAMDYDKQEEGMHTFEWADLWILNEYIKELQQKVNQLETNRDEAYKLLDDIDEYMLVEQHLKLVEAKKLLERGKE